MTWWTQLRCTRSWRPIRTGSPKEMSPDACPKAKAYGAPVDTAAPLLEVSDGIKFRMHEPEATNHHGSSFNSWQSRTKVRRNRESNGKDRLHCGSNVAANDLGQGRAQRASPCQGSSHRYLESKGLSRSSRGADVRRPAGCIDGEA